MPGNTAHERTLVGGPVESPADILETRIEQRGIRKAAAGSPRRDYDRPRAIPAKPRQQGASQRPALFEAGRLQRSPAHGLPGHRRGNLRTVQRHRRADERGRIQEQADRTGQGEPGGKGRAARSELPLQVRVRRKHVARAQDTAQQPADTRTAAGGKRAGHPYRETGRIRADHTRRGQRPAFSHRRHSGSGQDRVRHHHSEHCLRAAVRPALPRGEGIPAGGRRQGAGVRGGDRSRPPVRDPDRCQAPAADPEKPAVERLQVHRQRQGHAARVRGCAGIVSRASKARLGRRSHSILGHGYRCRHTGGQTQDHIRRFPAGRRHHQPSIRRDGAGPFDQPRARRAPGR